MYAAGTWMYRSGDLQDVMARFCAPAKSALPPSVAVVCRGYMDVQERRFTGCNGAILCSCKIGNAPSVAVVCCGTMGLQERRLTGFGGYHEIN